MPVWDAVDLERSTAALPSVHAARGSPGEGGAILTDFFGLEWDGVDVHERSHAAACAVVADKLVQLAALDVSGPIVGVSVFGAGAGVGAESPVWYVDFFLCVQWLDADAEWVAVFCAQRVNRLQLDRDGPDRFESLINLKLLREAARNMQVAHSRVLLSWSLGDVRRDRRNGDRTIPQKGHRGSQRWLSASPTGELILAGLAVVCRQDERLCSFAD